MTNEQVLNEDEVIIDEDTTTETITDDDYQIVEDDDQENVQEPKDLGNEKEKVEDSVEDSKRATETVSEDVTKKQDDRPNIPAPRRFNEKVIKNALEYLGISGDNLEDGLLSIVAEAEGISLEDAREKYKDEPLETSKEQKESVPAKEAEPVGEAERELIEIEKSLGVKFKSLYEIPNFEKYVSYRAAGVSPTDAYKKANTKETATKVQKQNSKAHLEATSNTHGTASGQIMISRSQLNAMREMMPDKSDKELIRLYREVTNH